MPPSRSRILVTSAFLAVTASAASAAPVPVVDRGPDRKNAPVANVRERDLGDGYFESGSSQFSEDGFGVLLDTLQQKGSYDPATDFFVDVDLRQEAHGFVAGHAIRWMAQGDPTRVKYDWVNLGRAREAIVTDEARWLSELGASTKYFVYDKDAATELDDGLREFVFAVPPDAPGKTEEAVVRAKLGDGHYIRLTIPDHLKPEDNGDLDLFLQLLARADEAARKENKKLWVHFHCAAGQGRTTTFLALYELYVTIVVRGQPASFDLPHDVTRFPQRFEDWLSSQQDKGKILTVEGKGGANLTFSNALEVAQKDKIRGLSAIDRFRFIANVYWYLADTGAKRSWSDWSVEHRCPLGKDIPEQVGTYRYCEF